MKWKEVAQALSAFRSENVSFLTETRCCDVSVLDALTRPGACPHLRDRSSAGKLEPFHSQCVCVCSMFIRKFLICSTENRIGTLPFPRMSTIVKACCNPTVRCIIVSEMYRPVCANFTPSRMRWSELNRQQFRLVYMQLLEQRSDL